MFTVNPDIIQRLIDLAREFHAQEAVSIPEESANPSGDWGAQMLASHKDDATVSEFRSIVEDLEPDQQQELVALFWVGREDFTAEDWDAAVAFAEDNWEPETADYLIAHPLLPDYLREGMDQLGLS